MPSIGVSSSRQAVMVGTCPADAAISGGMAVLAPALVRGCAAIAAVAAAAGGGLLVLRRITHAIDAAAPPLVLLAAAAAGVVVVRIADRGPRLAALAARGGMLCGMLALAFPPAATVAARAAAGIALAAAVAICLLPRNGSPVARPVRRAWRPDAAITSADTPRPTRRRRRRLPGSLRQRYERYESPAGGDCVRGRLAIAVPAGARTAAGHIGFCPAFTETPEAEVTTSYDGVEVTVAAAEVLPWGVRIECRLAEPAEEPLEIPVDILARVAGAPIA